MPSIASGAPSQCFACKCLNVRIQSAAPPTAPPESVVDPAYLLLYVDEEGIQVAHPQLTMRARQRVAPVPGTNRYSRFITLTCLLCELSAYRVCHAVPADVEGRDGPILPAEDWVEKETLKSSNGWIQVHKETLVGDAIIHAEANQTYSSLFNLLVPPISVQLPKVPQRANGSSVEEPVSDPELRTYLTDLKALFPPPPFTPSHPSFLHLAALADEKTKARRQAAEMFIADVVQQKIQEIEQGDVILRRQVEAIWRKFRETGKKLQGDYQAVARSSRSSERDSSGITFAPNSSPAYGSPIAIRDFIPVSVSERRPSSPPHRQSALSASLATTSFHHPRALQGVSPSFERSDSPDSNLSNTLSTRSGSATLVQQHTAPEAINVLQFRRNVDDTINTQASYRYFVNMEEDMAREKENRLKAAREKSSLESQQPSSSTRVAPEVDGTQKNGAPTAGKRTKEVPKSEDPPTYSRGRDPKGKRKVTFNVEPEMAAMNREAGADVVTPVATPTGREQDPREMIFDLEDMDGDRTSSPHIAQGLPLLEQPAVLRPLRPGKAKAKGLPESFAGLRPTSLPNPSHLRPSRSTPGFDASHATLLSLPYTPSTRRAKTNGTKSPTSEGKENTDAELHGPANGDLPGHRVASNVILEEGETDSLEAGTNAGPITECTGTSSVQKAGPIEMKDQDGLNSYNAAGAGAPGSLPVHIHMKTRPREVLSLASYQPQNAMPQHQSVAVTENHGKPMSTTAIRKAMYAERDRTRSVDPGTLELVEEEEDEDEDEDNLGGDDKAKIEALLSTTRGRRQALRILRAANKLPEAGMWRSLAS